MKIKNVYIAGGTGVVSIGVEQEIKNMNIKEIRISGADRFETSIKIAEQLGNVNEIILVDGEDFPGAIYMAPIAAKKIFL